MLENTSISAMCTKQKSCSICLVFNLDIITASETDDNNVKWSCKLRFCVPEVEWDEDCPVCQTCATQLDTFCSFRNRCLESSGRITHLEKSKRLVRYDSCRIGYQKCTCSFCSQFNVRTDNSIQKHKVEYTCYMCNKAFTTKVILENHIASHLNSCSFCLESFTTKTQLQLHTTQMHKDATESHICEICKTVFRSITYLTQHRKDVHHLLNYDNLDYKVENRAIYESSEKIHESLDNFKRECLPEDFKIDDGFYRSNNDETNTDQDDNSCLTSEDVKVEVDQEAQETKSIKTCKSTRKTFTCEECKSVFISSKKLINHAIRTHGFDLSAIKPFKCDKCDSKFSTSSNLLQHKKYHSGKRTHICTFCGKGYITKSDLNTHEKQHFNRREYHCSGCPKTFNTNKDLRSHRLVVHTDPSLWNYVCTFCQKRFPIKSNLDQHIRRHTGEKRFGCHICEKRFVDKVVLQKHIKSHSNFRAFKCPQCVKEYKDSRVLEVHLTKVHGIGNAKIPVRIKKYFCHVCPKSYFAKNKLTRHMFSHTGEKPFNCHICEKKFTDKSYVKQHLKTTHNVFKAEEAN